MNDEQLTRLLMADSLSVPGPLFDHYHEIGLTDIQMMMILQIIRLKQEGTEFTSPERIAARMSMDENHCTKVMQQLMQSHMIEMIETRQNDGKISEAVSVEPVYRKLAGFLISLEQEDDQETQKELEGRLFERFEQEFARPLSPMELEMISMWLDDDYHHPDLIEAALKEAVVSARINFRYIDRILYDWKKKGIQSIEQAREQGQKVRSAQRSRQTVTSAEQQRKPAQHPGYDWLKGE
ncbi:DnaD domain-containing protein [Salisediminibacterium selenitireducens]|uniref:Primosome, DnaD subunit n=1 Tax=Bacillus selenitireducens (strain ATCC 700615 / DSM 15326 / MLS10) TaxID=439292 RepID=D6XUW2_BACIE|nr:DnaD domain-containing protein [Salisediminibacterium selenitireducens]ADH99598.1 primosome, DnaD subunit [[Bacillus] selenitireducens MLS10]